jgi:hypothetical protein
MALTISEQKELDQIKIKLAQSGVEEKPSGAKEMALGLADTLASAGMEASGAALGGAIGAFPLLSVPTAGLSIPIGAGLGAIGGYLAKEYGHGREPTYGGATEAGIMGATPIGALAGAGTKQVISEGAKQVASSLAGTTAKTLIDERRVPTDKEAALSAAGAIFGTGLGRATATTKLTASQELAVKRQSQQAETDEALRMWQALGGVTDPVQANPSAVTHMVEAVGGKTAIAGQATLRNTLAAGDIARSQIGLEPNSPLTNKTLNLLREQVSGVYDRISSINSRAESLIDRLGTTREQARNYWREYGSNNSVEALNNARKLDGVSDTIEKSLEKIVNKVDPNLMSQFIEARRTLSQIHVVQSALTGPETGLLNPKVIGKIHDVNPGLLTDGLRAIGAAANIQPQIMGPYVRLPSGTSNAVANAAVTAGIASLSSPALAAGFVVSRLTNINPANILSKSNTYQNIMGIPRYQSGPTQNVSNFLMQTSRAAGQQPNQQQDQQP